jgi:hypothetical protein
MSPEGLKQLEGIGITGEYLRKEKGKDATLQILL